MSAVALSFDVYLAPLSLPDRPWDGEAVRRLLEARRDPKHAGQLQTSDGGADLYGDPGGDQWLMLNHIEGDEMWSVIHELAASGPNAVLPIGAPTFVAGLEDGAAVAPELPRPVVAVPSGEALRRAVESDVQGGLPPVRTVDAPASLLRFLEAHRTVLDRLTLSTAPLVMVSWYLLQPVEDVDLESDGDMLLCQWGTYDWGDGPTFEYDMTRQLTVDEPGELDPLIWQVSLTLQFPPQAGEGAGRGQRWCHHPGGLEDLQTFAMAAEPVRRLDRKPPLRVKLDFGVVD